MMMNNINYFGDLTDMENKTAEDSFSSHEAAQYLINEYKKRDIAPLIQSYIDKHPQFNEKEYYFLFNAENIKRWMSGKPISREKSFELSMYFEMPLKDAEMFVRKYCAHEWIYMRSYRDMIYYFILRNRNELALTGKDAVLTARRMTEEFESTYVEYLGLKVPAKNKSKNRLKRELFEAQLNSDPVNVPEKLTERCQNEVDNCKTQEELLEFLKANMSWFGEFRRKTHRIFMYEIELLKKNAGYTISEIASYIKIDFPEENGFKNDALLPFIKEFKNNNTDRQGLSATINKKKPVTRKQLLMVILLNENFEMNPINGDAYEEDMIEERRLRINSVLYDCGMPLLDALQPFDWLILNALSVIPYKDEDADERLNNIISALLKMINEGDANA